MVERNKNGQFVPKSKTNKWDFITAPRFWAMVGTAAVIGLQQDGLIGGGLATALLTIFGGFFSVKSFEKYFPPKK